MTESSNATGEPSKRPTLRAGGKLTRNATEVTVELIREAVFQGRLQPGDRLKEEELASELGISRTPVREALLVLQAEGLIVSTPNRGAMVRSYSETELLDLYELRALLEGFAARRAALSISNERLEALDGCCDRFTAMREGQDRLSLSRENLFFHNLVTEAADMARLPDLTRMVCEVPLVFQSFNWYTEEQAESSDRAHRQILKALHSRDPERAELAMKHHVLEGRDFLIPHVRAHYERTATAA